MWLICGLCVAYVRRAVGCGFLDPSWARFRNTRCVLVIGLVRFENGALFWGGQYVFFVYVGSMRFSLNHLVLMHKSILGVGGRHVLFVVVCELRVERDEVVVVCV